MSRWLFISWFLFALACSDTLLHAQNDSITNEQEKRLRRVKREDVFDELGKLFGKKVILKDTVAPGIYLLEDTILTNIFTFLPYVNYSPVTSLALGGLTSASFYAGRMKTTHLSSIDLLVAYTFNRQLITKLRSNIWQRENRYIFVGDWRYMIYPSYTFGLGPHTHQENKVLMDFSYLRIYQTAFKKIVPGFYLGLGYKLDYFFEIKELGAPQGTDFQLYKPGNETETTASGMTLNALFDNRKSSINPTAGSYYGFVSYRYNSTSLKSQSDWQSLVVDARKYFRLPQSSSNILAFWTYNWFTFGGNAPYFNLPSSSWDPNDNQGRGYIQGRFRSSNLISFETEYRFSLSENKLFGGVVFANIQSVSSLGRADFNTFYPGVGTGIRLKFNKETNTNLSIDYGIGLDGSQNVFFNLGEAF